MNTAPLPITKDISTSYILSLIAALLMALASLAGISFQSFLYPVEELRRSFVANDMVNLVIGLPVLLGSMWSTRRGRLIGLLFWPGALLYVIYNYIAYTIAMSTSILFFPCLVMVVMATYAMIQLFRSIDMNSVKDRLAGAVPEPIGGGVLAGLGALFFLRTIGQAAGILTGQITLEGAEYGVMLADLLTTPLWVIGGILLWCKQPFGYASGAGLLFQASMLFIGLLIFFILQPFLSALPFRAEDFVVVLIMGLICFIPFGIYVRGIVRGRG